MSGLRSGIFSPTATIKPAAGRVNLPQTSSVTWENPPGKAAALGPTGGLSRVLYSARHHLGAYRLAVVDGEIVGRLDGLGGFGWTRRVPQT